MSTSFSILSIGNFECPGFRDAGKWLARNSALNALDIRSAIAAIRNHISPAVIVIAQRWPGEFSATDVEQLRIATPLARIVGLLGPWMEGEIRTGRPLPGAPRFYWHQWPRLARQIELLEASNDSPLVLPSTAAEDEKMLATIAPTKSSQATERILIVARHRETALSLTDLCSTRGWSARWLQSVPSEALPETDAVIFDILRGTADDLEFIAAVKALTRPAPILAIAGFPRCSDVDQLHRAGAAAVVSKPYLACDLLWQLEQVTNRFAA